LLVLALYAIARFARLSWLCMPSLASLACLGFALFLARLSWLCAKKRKNKQKKGKCLVLLFILNVSKPKKSHNEK
jgi:hypothetical protein